MARKSLAERLAENERRQARLAEDKAKIREDERKARNRALFTAGGLVEKAGLLTLEANALYGALLSLRDGADDKKTVEQWAALGGRTFAREARLRDEGKEPFLLTFPAPLAKETTAILRAAGFRYSAVLRHWEGMAKPDDADALVAAHGGTARRVSVAAEASSETSRSAAPVDATAARATGRRTMPEDTGDLLSRGEN